MTGNTPLGTSKTTWDDKRVVIPESRGTKKRVARRIVRKIGTVCVAAVAGFVILATSLGIVASPSQAKDSHAYEQDVSGQIVGHRHTYDVSGTVTLQLRKGTISGCLLAKTGEVIRLDGEFRYELLSGLLKVTSGTYSIVDREYTIAPSSLSFSLMTWVVDGQLHSDIASPISVKIHPSAEAGGAA